VIKLNLAVVFALLCSVANAATPAPQVVFIGDYYTYNWTSAFAANPNWINKGINGNDLDGQTSSDVLARFQTDVVSLNPAIVHIMVGDFDAEISSAASTQYTPPAFAANLDAMVKAATAANIKVILGISPGIGPDGGIGYLLPQIDSIIAAYGAANKSRSSTTKTLCASALAHWAKLPTPPTPSSSSSLRFHLFLVLRHCSPPPQATQ
jgi:hypothetical protein